MSVEAKLSLVPNRHPGSREELLMDNQHAAPISAPPPTAPGKRRLMSAALRLAARSRSLHALSLRELAREAGLNPNTFYRHFANLDALGRAIIDELVLGLRQPLREQRFRAALAAGRGDRKGTGEDSAVRMRSARIMTRETVALFFDYVLQNPEGFIIGIRELHGCSPTLRQALRQAMEDFARDLTDDSLQLGLMPDGARQPLHLVSRTIVRQMFELSLDYIEYPQQRDQTREQAEAMILMLFTGSWAFHSL